MVYDLWNKKSQNKSYQSGHQNNPAVMFQKATQLSYKKALAAFWNETAELTLRSHLKRQHSSYFYDPLTLESRTVIVELIKGH